MNGITRTVFLLILGGISVSALAQTTLPLPGGTSIVRGQKYYSRSGDHYLLFQADGNLVVNTSANKRVWGLDKVFPNFRSAGRVEMQTDGNLVVYNASNGYLWSALTQNPDPRAQLVLNPRGALQLVSSGRGVLWSSDGDFTTEIDRLRADCQSCGTGLQLLSANMYRYSENPKVAPAGRRAWNDVFGEFRQKHLQACNDVGAFIKAHRGEPVLSSVEQAIVASGVAGWENYFTGRVGIVMNGERIGQYCPGLHLSQFDCVEASKRMGSSIAGAQKVIDLLNSIECLPDNGWAYCRSLADPKIKIMGSKAVSQSAMEVVEDIYTEITKRFTSKYPKNKFDGYVIYMTNGEPWSELSNLAPIGTMMVDEKGVNQGDELRGGTSPDYLWISEQMICKKGVRTRNEAFAAGKRAERDDTERTFDQVIHEFGHAIDFKYGLRDRINQVYKGGWNPVEQFPWSIQHWFGTPSGTLSASESAFIGEIFSSKTTFPCDKYKPDAK